MQVDLQQFRGEGYLVLKNVVPPERLGAMRLAIEWMVDQEKARSAAVRQPGDPLGSAWYESIHPRLTMNSLDADTADVIDFCLGETTLGVSAQLMQAPVTALTAFGVLCSGLIDYGYADWHRDASSAEQAPLSGMQADLMANAPGYVQWNIALYEDDVFWILPASHKQPTNEAQRRQLMLDPKVPLEGGIPVELQPGDGIVYPNLMMHWGSQYTSRLRRTIHLGYRSFGSQIFSYHHHLDWYHADGFLQHISPAAKARFAHWAECYDRERDQIEATFRTLIARDEPKFRACLAKLHPGEFGRMVSVVLLCRIANKGERGAVVPDRQQSRLPAPARDRPEVRARAQAADRRVAARILRRGHGAALHRRRGHSSAKLLGRAQRAVAARRSPRPPALQRCLRGPPARRPAEL